MGTRKRPDDIRRAIVDAAVALIAEGGPEQVSLRPLMSRLSLTTGAFYRCFPGGRDALLDAAARDASQRVLDRLGGEGALAGLAPRDALLRLGRDLIGLLDEQGRLVEFVLSHPLAADEGPYPVARLTRATVARAAADHGLDARLLFAQVWAFICGLVQLTRLGLVEDTGTLMTTTLDTLLAGGAVQPPDPTPIPKEDS